VASTGKEKTIDMKKALESFDAAYNEAFNRDDAAGCAAFLGALGRADLDDIKQGFGGAVQSLDAREILLCDLERVVR
jgi:hypothetical protein